MSHLKNLGIHLANLEKIVIETKEHFEGNCFYYHGTFRTDKSFFPKQLNIMDIAAKCNNIIEIGFNAGHSALLMLEANPNANIQIFDICEHGYTEKCFDYLNKVYGNRMTLHRGNSHSTLSNFKNQNPEYRFDLIHIDGNHSYNHANLDYFISKAMSKPGSYCMFDDLQISYLKSLWDGYVKDGHLEVIPTRPTGAHKHGIGKFL